CACAPRPLNLNAADRSGAVQMQGRYIEMALARRLVHLRWKALENLGAAVLNFRFNVRAVVRPLGRIAPSQNALGLNVSINVRQSHARHLFTIFYRDRAGEATD